MNDLSNAATVEEQCREFQLDMARRLANDVSNVIVRVAAMKESVDLAVRPVERAGRLSAMVTATLRRYGKTRSSRCYIPVGMPWPVIEDQVYKAIGRAALAIDRELGREAMDRED